MAAKKTFKDIKEDVIKNGGYHVSFYFDLHSNSKDALRDVMVGFIGKLTNEEGVAYGVGEIDEPIEHDTLYSSTAKVNLLVNDFPALVKLCSTYGPIAIEIEEPLEMRPPVHQVQEALLQVSAMSQEFTKLMLKKLMTDDEKNEFEKKMMQRAALGRRLLDKEKGIKA